MAIRKFVSILAITVLGSACVTGSYAVTIVKDPRNNGKSQYGPVGGASDRTGAIWYYNQINNDGRREVCFKNMFEMCGGKYKILEEGEVADGGGIGMGTKIGGGVSAASFGSYTRYIFKFECID